MSASEKTEEPGRMAGPQLEALRLAPGQRHAAGRMHRLPRAATLLLATVVGGAAVYLFFPKAVPQSDTQARSMQGAIAAAGQDAARSPAGALVMNGFLVARRHATVSSPVSGRIERVLVAPGMAVRRGQAVAMLDTRDAQVQLDLAMAQVRSAQARLAEFEVEIALSGKQAERASQLGASGMISAASVEDAALKHLGLMRQMATVRELLRSQEIAREQALIALDNTTIRAPLSGVVVATSAQPGEIVTPLSAVGSGTRSGICTIVDPDSLEVELEVPERLLYKVRAGQAVSVTLDALPGLLLAGKVASIAPIANRGAGSVPVHVNVDSKGRKLLPDMTATVTWELE